MNFWFKSILLCLLWSVYTLALAFDAAPYFNASQQFERFVVQSLPHHKLPRIDNREVADLIAVLSDSERFLNSTTFRLQDLDALMDICNKANSLSLTYVLFDLNNSVNPKDEPAAIAAQVAKRMEDNIQTFQDELEQLQPFIHRCIAKEIPLLNESVLTLPSEKLSESRRAGLQKFRTGIFQVFYGSLQVASSPQYKESYRLKLLQSLADTASHFSSVIQPTVRQDIFNFAVQAKSTAPAAFCKLLQNIANAMAEKSCNELCLL